MADKYGDPATGDKIVILYAPPGLIESGERVMKREYDKQMKREEEERLMRDESWFDWLRRLYSSS